ncbi:MAG TPA: type II toxin-antitoxin system VapC family toxin [Candidatus Bathyarchaeia archaeon]
MTSKYIIDSSAWIEYFRSSKYEAAKEYIENADCITPTIVVSEISRKLQKEIELGDETVEGRLKRLEFISATSQIVELDFELADLAGKTDLEMKKKAEGWGLADSIVLCAARSFKGKVVTGDEHFKDLDEVIFVK